MGHSDNHTVKRVPIVLAGQGGGMLKTGRYVRYADNQQLGRLHLSLLKMFDVETDSYAGSSEALPGLADSNFVPWKEQPFQSWVKTRNNEITVQGRLRMSDNLDEAKLFFIDVDGKPSVRVEVEFGDFHRFNIAYHCGTPVTMVGTGTINGDQMKITKVKSLDSLFGKRVDGAPG
jgi:hypothetical protein